MLKATDSILLVITVIKAMKTKIKVKEMDPGISLVICWLRLCTPNAKGLGSTPDQETGAHMPQRKDPTC